MALMPILLKGNMIMLAISIMRIGNGELFDVKNIASSLGCFAAGCFVVGQPRHWQCVDQRRRLWLIVTRGIGTLLVIGAAAVQFIYGVSDNGPAALGIIARLAFASGARVAISRAYICTEISTAMATAAWVDLMLDGELFRKNNRGRNRRVAFLVSLFGGGLVGGVMYKHSGSAIAIPLSAIIKGLVMISLLFNKK